MKYDAFCIEKREYLLISLVHRYLTSYEYPGNRNIICIWFEFETICKQ